jgi:hypothetical protein
LSGRSPQRGVFCKKGTIAQKGDLHQSQPARSSAPAPSKSEPPTVLADFFKAIWFTGKMGVSAVSMTKRSGKKKLVALISPRIGMRPAANSRLKFHNRVAPQHPEFEIVFISSIARRWYGNKLLIVTVAHIVI